LFSFLSSFLFPLSLYGWKNMFFACPSPLASYPCMGHCFAQHTSALNRRYFAGRRQTSGDRNSAKKHSTGRYTEAWRNTNSSLGANWSWSMEECKRFTRCKLVREKVECDGNNNSHQQLELSVPSRGLVLNC
jgi:hypothetical protein